MTTLKLRVHSGRSTSNSHVESLTSDSPSEGVLRSTTNKLERKNVNLKILGKGTQGTDRDSKPSNRMQQLIIGKTPEMKKEDSLIDEYKNSDTSKDDGAEDSETHYVRRPTMRSKVHVKETQFHDLVIKPTQESSIAPAEKEPGTDGSRVRDVSDEDAEKKNQVETNNDKEDMNGRASRTEEAALDKGRVSQYSKIKADTEEKEEQVNENEKEMDPGEAFLKKQQLLMHRGNGAEEDVKVAGKGSDFNEKVAGRGEAEKTNDASEKHSSHIGNEKIGDGTIDAGNRDDNAIEELDSDKVKGDRANDGETDTKGAKRMSNLKREESKGGNKIIKEEKEESKGGHEDTKGGYEDSMGGNEESKGGYDDSKKGNEESKRGYEDSKGGSEVSKGGYKDSKGGKEASKGEYEDSKGGSEESKGGYEDSKGENEESKQRYEKTKERQAAKKEDSKETEEEYERSNSLNEKKEEERSQLPAPVSRRKKDPARINSEVKGNTEVSYIFLGLSTYRAF